ncbi:MAG: hypothetical protein HYY49_07705 [Ignavibacteriales bacterium]|nr:hypothetical protein [Ignavibacteriales bacterium]
MKTRIVAFSILGFVLSACHTAQFTLHVPPKQERPFRVLKHVSVESKGGWLFSLLLVKQTEVHDLLKKQVESVQGDKAVNIRITDK